MTARSAGSRLAVVMALALGAVALADDTELFVTRTDPQAATDQPNVLFLIDTSGSMDTQVLTQAPWDPALSYAGCYRSDALYYSSVAELPACDSIAVVAKSANRCAASRAALDGIGAYTGAVLAWDKNRERWVAPDPALAEPLLECRDDRGQDGSGSGGGLYAADGPNGPWAVDSTNEPSWSNTLTLYDGNWLNWQSAPPSISRSRLDIVKSGLNDVLAELSDLNVGVMRFNADNGGSVVQPLADLDTARDVIRATIDGLEVGGATPLSEALYEAGQYYAGRLVDFGNLPPVPSVAGSRIGNTSTSGTYLSPFASACQRSYVVLITDGGPANDLDANSRIAALPGFAATVGPACDGEGEGACLDDMAEYLFAVDQSGNLDGIQNVVTDVIGFSTEIELLQATARRGGGRFFLADNLAEFAAALGNIAQAVQRRGNVFAAPAVPVNALNRTANLDDIYFGLFEPAGTARWPGNLKKYRLRDATVVDREGRPAIDPATGFFSSSAFSFWSPARDGDDVRAGGAASQLPDPFERRVFTNVSGPDLSATPNALAVTNTAISAARLGAPEEERDAVIEWARGADVRDEDGDGTVSESRRDMGDPLHSRPLTVSYGAEAGRTQTTIFLSTNDGYLHAFDAESGAELWSFVPARLLGRLYALYRNEDTPARSYGLDGELRAYLRNDDGAPGIGGDEQLILLFGMRRGGDAVFALDVTEREAPRLLWEIDSRTAGFSALGQTWSPPQVSRVDVAGRDREVVWFAGGYDSGQDTGEFRSDTVGNALFLVDLDDGELIWSAGNADEHDLRLPAMRFSIPAGLRVLDLSQDGRADRIYVGDMGGQVWRFDIRNGQLAGQLVDGGVIASLGGAAAGSTPPTASLRRFYATPDVVAVFTPGERFLSINLGSGYRAHPLDTDIADAFFSIRDFRVFEPLDTADYGAPITIDDLVDVTSDAAPPIDPREAGWRLRLTQGDGEKVLGESVTLANTVFFSSFTPLTNTASCVTSAGVNRLYQVSVIDARPQTNFDESVNDTPLTTSDRSVALRQAGIAPEPLPFFPAGDDEPLICVGAECLEPTGPDGSPLGGTRRTYWFQDQAP